MRLAGAASMVLAAVLLLAGCAATPAPKPVPDAELRQMLSSRIDAAWQNTGLATSMSQPVTDESTMLDEYNRAGAKKLAGCLAEAGIESWGTGEVGGGPAFITGTGAPALPKDQLAWYLCFSRYPNDVNFAGFRLSDEEIDYLYDYYQQWVMPCLAMNHFDVVDVPTRANFSTDGNVWWNPYVTMSEQLTSMESFNAAIALCGDPYADLEYGPYFQ